MRQSNAFVWENRKFCLQRIYVLVACKRVAINRAIQEALSYKHPTETKYAYCQNPDQIDDVQMEQLRKDASEYIQKLGELRPKKKQSASHADCR